MSENKFAFLIETLETFQNLLHAETQAIAAKDLDIIDSLISQKDDILKVFLSFDQNIYNDSHFNSSTKSKFDYALKLQARNVESFKKLRASVNQGSKVPANNPTQNKAIVAYLSNQDHVGN